ncbi:MAG: OmpA family protein, partial [Candidatus Obscuribacterales bacterium]|nr:OmpA family protein [Candidatus Obscuribacterales bacterium]
MLKSRFVSCFLGLMIASSVSVNNARADWGSDADRINKNWQNIDDKLKRNEDYWKKKPGEMQVPGEIQRPGTFRDVGEFRKALSEGKVIKQEAAPCHRRFCVGADTLFNFDESTLTPYAEEALQALGPMIVKLGAHPVRIEGHTDSEGTDEYNQKLSQKRAERVKNWLLQNHFVPVGAQTEGFGEQRPRSPNKKPDGTDNPEGRALNRRVEIIVDTCTALNGATAPASAVGAAVPGEQSPGATRPGEPTKAALSTVDLTEMLPYANLYSSQDLKTNFNKMTFKPLGDPALSFEVLAPTDWEEDPVELTAAQLEQDRMVQIALAGLTPKDNDNVRLEVRYLRAADDTNLGGFVKAFASKNNLELLGRQPADFNGRQVEDVLLRTQDKDKEPVLI